MDIKALSDQQLHQNLLTLKSKESLILAKIISHLDEVYRRRLFADYKCSSIYDYCIHILGYSNGEAHRKISACKLASTVAGVKESIAKGELSLSNAASVQVFINQSKKQQKTLASLGSRTGDMDGDGIETAVVNRPLCAESIIERVKNKSTRECEIELEKIAAENNIETPEKSVSKRRVGDKTQLKVYLDTDKLQLLKTRLNIQCEQELLQTLLDEKLEATEPKQEIQPRPRKQPSLKPRSISPAKKAIVFKKAQNKCENCGSKHFLQVDHKTPVASQGGNDTENLRILCRSCNQRAAIEQLGLDHMNRYINKSSEYGSSPRRREKDIRAK